MALTAALIIIGGGGLLGLMVVSLGFIVAKLWEFRRWQ